jgi:hypothetical protein
MGTKKTINRLLARIAWGSLLIWWGVVIMIDPLTIGIGAMVSGMILLGINAFRWLKGIPTRERTTQIGSIALLWGALDQARYVLGLPGGLSFALLLVVNGLAVLAAPLLARRKLHHVQSSGDV